MVDQPEILIGVDQVALSEEILQAPGGIKAAAEVERGPEEADLRKFDGGGVV